MSDSVPSAEDEEWAFGSLLWPFVGGITCLSMAPLEPNLIEEGLMVHVAERMLGGEHLYRDIVSVTGPVPYWLVAAAFALVGDTIAEARGVVVVLHALACGSVFGLARRCGAGAWAHAAAAVFAVAPVPLFPLLSTMFYTTVATSLGVIAGYAALRGVTSLRWGIAAGVLIALTALSKQTVGAVLALTLVPAVAFGATLDARLRAGLSVCVGGAAVTVATLLMFALLGDLGSFVGSMLAMPEGDVFGLPFINLWPPGELSHEIEIADSHYVPASLHMLREGPASPFWILVTQLTYAAPLVALGLALLLRMRGALPAASWVFAALVLANATNLYPRADAGHLVFVLPIALAYLVTTLATMGFRARPRGALHGGFAVATIVGVLAGAATVAVGLYSVSTEPTWGPRVPQRIVSVSKRATAVPRVIHYLRERIEPGEPIYVARAEPLIYFATGATNPTPFTGALQVWGIRGEQQDATLRALETVRFVVMSDLDGPLHSYFSDQQPLVQAYLERHFHVPPEFVGHYRLHDWMLVLERGEDRGESAIDLHDPSIPRRLWSRRADGGIQVVESGLRRLGVRQNRRPMATQADALGSGIDFELRLPQGARFEAGVGFHRISETFQPNGTEFIVSIDDGETFRELGRFPVWFQNDTKGRVWRTIEVDLAEFGGSRRTLRLETRGPGEVAGFGFWGSPRITSSE